MPGEREREREREMEGGGMHIHNSNDNAYLLLLNGNLTHLKVFQSELESAKKASR